MTELEPIVILCVEDNAGDAELVRLSFKQFKIANEMLLATDGEQALDILYQRNGYEDVPAPDLILLDLNLPKIERREVLADIKNNDNLKTIPVVVLSSSEAAEDIQEAYSLHVNCFVSKPVSALDFIKTVNLISDFWITVAKRAA